MKPKLQKQLYDKYPKIFQDRTKSMKATCMCWGICTGDGWYNLLDNLCHSLQWNTDMNHYPQVVADQVKEKMSSLRFYFHTTKTSKSKKSNNKDYESGRINGMVDFAEKISKTTCEICGNPGTINKGPWYKVRCPPCKKKDL